MPTGSSCKKTRLAANGVGSIDQCSCGAVQLHLGATTIRFTPEALGELYGLVRSGAAELAARSAEPPSGAPVSRTIN